MNFALGGVRHGTRQVRRHRDTKVRECGGVEVSCTENNRINSCVILCHLFALSNEIGAHQVKM